MKCHSRTNVSTPLLETLKAVNASGFYTTVVRNRSDFVMPVEGDKIEAITVRPLQAFFWMSHSELCHPEVGFYAALLQALMTGSSIASRRFAAASFLLRYGWSSGAMIAPLLMDRPIPWYTAEEAALCFADNTLFQAICLGSDHFIIDQKHAYSAHPHCALVYSDKDVAIRWIADQLLCQAQPIVEALHRWSGFSHKALWAMVSSSWIGQLLNVSKTLQRPAERLRRYLTVFYEHWQPLTDALPRCYFIREQDKTHFFHVRASCCLYFKGKERHFCASCPVLPEDERIKRNRQWIEKYG